MEMEPITKHFAAPPEAVWAVIGDFGGIARWTSQITSSRMEHDAKPDVGAVRICEAPGFGTVRERVLAWDEGRSFTYGLIPTGPFRRAQNTWTVTRAPGGCTLTLTPEVELRFGWLGRMFFRLVMKPRLRRISRELLGELEREVAARAPELRATSWA